MDDPIARTLATILENQQRRTEAAFEGLPDRLFTAAPGSDCRSIRDVGAHLLGLRRFLLEILESPRAADIDERTPPASARDLLTRLRDATGLVGEAVAGHDSDDWYRVPETPRQGPWGDEPTILRLSRPLNDFVSHLGSIRTIRRIAGSGASRTQ